MKNQGRFLMVLIFLLCLLLMGCISNVWTGALLVYDRHSVYKKLNDYELSLAVHKKLYSDNLLKQDGCSLDIAVFNGNILIAGHLPTLVLRNETIARLKSLKGYNKIFNQIKVSSAPSNTIQDAWTTAKIRSKIFTDSSIDPNTFKVVTKDRVVYLMGDVKYDEAQKFITMARNTVGVLRVVTLLRYYELKDFS